MMVKKWYNLLGLFIDNACIEELASCMGTYRLEREIDVTPDYDVAVTRFV